MVCSTYHSRRLISLQGQDGKQYTFTTEEAVKLPANQVSVLTLPHFYAIPQLQGTSETSGAQSKYVDEDSGAQMGWSLLQLDSLKGTSSRKRAAKLIAGTALAPV